MKLPVLSAVGAIFWGGLVAGLLDIGSVLAIWAAKSVPPVVIFQSIASSLLGPSAFQGGLGAALLGGALHFAVSFTFAIAYVVVSARAPILRSRPVVFGLLYGLVAYVIMRFAVVPLTLADFGPSTLQQDAQSLAIHMLLFGLPIALAASRIKGRDQTV